MKINAPVDITSYDKGIPSTVSLILNENASNIKIYNLTFVNSTINIDNASNVVIAENIFNSTISTILSVDHGENNVFRDNEVYINATEISAMLCLAP